MNIPAVAVASIGVLVAAGIIVPRIFREARRSRESRMRFRQHVAAISALPVTKTRQRAEELLGDPDRFICIVSRGPAAGDWALPDTVRSLFERYEHIEDTFGLSRLNRNNIGPAELAQGCVRIGTEFDGSEVVVRPHADAVYVVDGCEQTEAERWSDSYPSVFHWLILRDRSEDE